VIHPTVNGEPVLVGNWIDVQPFYGHDFSGVVKEIRIVRNEIWIETNVGRNVVIRPEHVLAQRTLEDAERTELLDSEDKRWRKQMGYDD
jgi:hypothetical protein